MVLYRTALTALAKASLVLVACMAISSLSGHGLGPSLRAAILAFGLLGGIALGRGLRAERSSEHEQAGSLYALALVNYFICYVALLVDSLLGRSDGS
jgi:heme O synthase-like polyprenyltransferase